MLHGRACDALRQIVRLACGCCLCVALATTLAPSSAATAVGPPPSRDGDLLNLCDAQGPAAHELWVRYRFAREESDQLGIIETSALVLQHGLGHGLSAGLSTGYLAQEREAAQDSPPLVKRGLADTRLLVKWRLAPDEGGALRTAWRCALRIPTGYDRDADGLTPFTTRTVDFEGLGILGIRTQQVDFCFNAGFSLPGADRANELLGGLGFLVTQGLPLGLGVSGEFFTRYDIPAEQFRHEIFGGLRLPVAYGLAAELGLRKALADRETSQPEVNLRISRGWSDVAEPFSPGEPIGPPMSIALREVLLAEDPHGFARSAAQALQLLLAREPSLRLSDPGSAEYLVDLSIVSMEEGYARGFRIPKLLATPQATLNVLAQLRLSDSERGSTVAERPLVIRLRRGTGAVLVPSDSDEDTWIPPAQVRRALRESGARRLAEQARHAIVAALATR